MFIVSGRRKQSEIALIRFSGAHLELSFSLYKGQSSFGLYSLLECSPLGFQTKSLLETWFSQLVFPAL